MADDTPARGVTVVIPCRDEAQALPGVLARVPDEYEALVVDNGSTDGTGDVARAHGATVVVETVPGYGSAVDAGVRAASGEIVCTIDGDGSMDPEDLRDLVDEVRRGADLAVGRRRPSRRGVWPLHSRIGSGLVARRIRRLHGLDVHDIGPMRAARRSRLLELSVRDMRFGYPVELLVRAGQANWLVVERDVVYNPRAAGESKVSGSMMGSVRATRDFLVALR
ncbi:glycosyltransferase family 2 protein [Williamsia sp. SKLECPSW1]